MKGEKLFPLVWTYPGLKAKQSSSIFSEWSHHFTVKDRCLVEQKPRQQPHSVQSVAPQHPHTDKPGFINPEFSHRTAVGVWLQETLKGPTDSELEAFMLCSTKSRPKTKLKGGGEVLLFEGGQNFKPNLLEPIRLFPSNMRFIGSLKTKNMRTVKTSTATSYRWDHLGVRGSL